MATDLVTAISEERQPNLIERGARIDPLWGPKLLFFSEFLGGRQGRLLQPPQLVNGVPFTRSVLGPTEGGRTDPRTGGWVSKGAKWNEKGKVLVPRSVGAQNLPNELPSNCWVVTARLLVLGWLESERLQHNVWLMSQEKILQPTGESVNYVATGLLLLRLLSEVRCGCQANGVVAKDRELLPGELWSGY